MSRDLSANNQSKVTDPVTRPVWLLELLYSTPIRLSSREDVTEYEGKTFEPATMRVEYNGDTANVRFFDQDLKYSPIMVAEGQGQDAILHKVYGDPPFADGAAEIYLDGEIGPSTIDDFINVRLLASGPGVAPRYRATAELGLNHLPASGTEIQTRAGTFILERND